MSEDYKALTVVHLPYVEERYEPGAMIPRDRFDAYEAAARALLGDDAMSADDQIAELMQHGSLSDDPEAKLHPQHRVPDPNTRSLSQIVSDAEALVAELNEAGVEVPAKLRALTEISDRQLSAVDAGIGGESVVSE